MEAAAGPEALTASFSAEEQRLIDELRSKYTRGEQEHGLKRSGAHTECFSAAAVAAAARAGPLEPPPPAPASTQAQAQPPAAAPAAQTASCRLCAECQGTGSVVEAYNHRTLERSCTQCGGQGTVRTNAGSGGSSTHNGDGSMRGSSSTQGSTPCSSSGGAKSTHERLAGWEAELEALKQSLAGATDSRELQLKSALILELERAAASLRARLTQVGEAARRLQGWAWTHMPAHA